MKMFTKLFAVAATFSIIIIGNAEVADCYQKPGDKTETISDNGTAFVWRYGKKKVIFETGGAGTGWINGWRSIKKAKAFATNIRLGI